MKKKLAIILCTSLSLSLFACGGNNSKSSSGVSSTTSVEQGSGKSGSIASGTSSTSKSGSTVKLIIVLRKQATALEALVQMMLKKAHLQAIQTAILLRMTSLELK